MRNRKITSRIPLPVKIREAPAQQRGRENRKREIIHIGEEGAWS